MREAKLDIETRKIKLGHEEYTVTALSYHKAKGWKKLLVDTVHPLFDQFAALAAVEWKNPESVRGSIHNVWPLAEHAMLEGIDDVLNALCAYADILTDSREAIEDTATHKQIAAAFLEVVDLENPLSGTGSTTRVRGQKTKVTSPNLPAQSGDSALKMPRNYPRQ